MVRKIISTNFLLLGSFLIISSLLFSCEKVDYRVRAEWIYINETPYKIEVKARTFDIFTILPGETFFYKEDGDGPKNMQPKNYFPPCRSGTVIILDDTTEYELVKGESITNVENYTIEKVGTNYYSFTYVFNEENLNWLQTP